MKKAGKIILIIVAALALLYGVMYFISKPYIDQFNKGVTSTARGLLGDTDCGCDYTIAPIPGSTAAVQTYDAAGKTGTICIQAGTRLALQIKNILGTPTNPVIIRNCGGRVIINSTYSYGLNITNSKYFELDGTLGDEEYGIKVDNNYVSQAVHLSGRTSHYVIRGLEITRAGFAGIMSKSDPYCPGTLPTVTKENFSMDSIVIENNYIHDTKSGEGMYIGYTFPVKTISGCNLTVNSHRSKSIIIRNNIVEKTGADGIQVSQCEQGLQIYGNKITNYGKDPFQQYQNSGISIGALNKGDVHDNFINGAAVVGVNGGNGISNVGSDQVNYYNNVIVNAGEKGMYIDAQESKYIDLGGPGTTIYHNIIVLKPGRVDDGIQIRNVRNPTIVRNNVIITQGTYVMKYFSSVPLTESNNAKQRNYAGFNFADTLNFNFHISAGSTLINVGILVTGAALDIDSVSRPFGSAPDIGIHEFVVPVIPNAPPIVSLVSGSPDSIRQNLVLNLEANVSDTDGVIASVQWTKVSGGPATLVSAGNTLTVTNMLPGDYVFNFAATDDDNEVSSFQKSVRVLEPYAPPVEGLAAGYQSLKLFTTIETKTSDTVGALAVQVLPGDTIDFVYYLSTRSESVNGIKYRLIAPEGTRISYTLLGTGAGLNAAPTYQRLAQNAISKAYNTVRGVGEMELKGTIYGGSTAGRVLIKYEAASQGIKAMILPDSKAIFTKK